MSKERNHPLFVGEVVFDVDKMFFGVITELTKDKAVLDMNGKPKNSNVTIGWCEKENRIMFDVEITEEETKWECNSLDSLYQIAWGIVDCRTENIVCYEHNEMTNEDYPFYSPYLDENLFNIETEIQ